MDSCGGRRDYVWSWRIISLPRHFTSVVAPIHDVISLHDGPGITPDSKVHGANMGPIWGRQDPGGPHVGPMNFAILDIKRRHEYKYM